MDTNIQELFLQLVRLGIGHADRAGFKSQVLGSIDWAALKALAERQGLSAVVLDGIDKLNTNNPNFTIMPQMLRLEWIGQVLNDETICKAQKAEAEKMAALFSRNYLRTYVLKGEVVSECYPRPEHRVSVDLDCFLLKEFDDSGVVHLAKQSTNNQRYINKGWDAWSFGNDLIRSKGLQVVENYYKNSTFYLPGLTVENHRYLTPFRGNKRLKRLEKLLQSWIREDKELRAFEGTWLYKPPVMVSALFLIEHAYSHFLHEGLTWRHVLDWTMFSNKHNAEIKWEELEARIDEFGFRKFYNSYYRLGRYLMGEMNESDLSHQDKLMLEDIWAPLDLHETVRGLRGKLALTGNTWRARWKYRHFTDMSWISALWIQTKGVLFEKDVVL